MERQLYVLEQHLKDLIKKCMGNTHILDLLVILFNYGGLDLLNKVEIKIEPTQNSSEYDQVELEYYIDQQQNEYQKYLE